MNMRRRGATVLAAGLTTFALLASTPAWANESNIVWCDYGQKGRTFWREPANVDEIAWFHGMWIHRSNPGQVVHGESQGVGVSGPTNIEIWGQGTHEWLFYGVVVHFDDWLMRGGKCEGDSQLANLAGNAVDMDGSASRLTPPPLSLAHLPVEDITAPITG